MPSLMVDPDEFGAMLGNVQNEWQAAGRDLATLDLTIWGVQTREAAQQARALGANRIVFRLDTDSAATLGADLDAYWEIGQTLS